MDRGVDLVAADADGGSDRNENILYPRGKSFLEEIDHPRCDTQGRAPPPRMGDSDDPADAVYKEERDAVRRPDSQGHPRPIRDQAVALGDGSRRRAVPVEDTDPVAVDLTQQDQPAGRNRKRIGDQRQVPTDIFLPVGHTKTRVEAGERSLTYPSYTGAEGMGHEIQRRDDLGLQILDSASLGKTEHALPFYPLPQGGAKRGDILRLGRRKPHRFPRRRMGKGETIGVEGLTVQFLHPCP
jgi:hypothetical protein